MAMKSEFYLKFYEGRVASKKTEKVTTSFHYLVKRGEEDGTFDGFSHSEFEKLLDGIENQEEVDLADPITLERVRFGRVVPFSQFEKKDGRTAFAKFKAPYSGHAFNNSEKGKISAESVNQRTFDFMLYYAKDGKIFVGAQYLGNYGGWLPLAYSLKQILGDPSGIAASSFRNDLIYLENAHPKELRVNIHRQAKRLAEDPTVAAKAMVAFQRVERGDRFETETKKSLFQLFGKSPDLIKKHLIKELKNNGLTEIDEDEIENCVVIADVNGREKRFYFLDQLNVATRFPVHVGLDDDGHPFEGPLRKKMLDLLEDQIVSKLGKS